MISFGFQTEWLTAATEEFWSFSGAVVGASITVIGAYLLTSMETARKRRRSLTAARAVLASDLSLICDYVAQCAKVIMEWGDTISRSRAEKLDGRQFLPELDPNVLLRLENLVELERGGDAARVVDLMHCYQIVMARMKSTARDLKNPSKLVDRQDVISPLGAVAELDLRARALFPYARKGGGHRGGGPPFSENDISTSLLGGLDIFDWLTSDERIFVYDYVKTIGPVSKWRQ